MTSNDRRKKQIELDTFLVITNRILDVAIMFLSIFTVIYFCNGQPFVALGTLIADLIIIPLNNGKQTFDYLHDKLRMIKQDL